MDRPDPAPREIELVVMPFRRGRWLVQETRGLFGGLFTSFEEAMRYVREQSRLLPGAHFRFAEARIPAGPWQ